jgi:hypothetical protein
VSVCVASVSLIVFAVCCECACVWSPPFSGEISQRLPTNCQFISRLSCSRALSLITAQPSHTILLAARCSALASDLSLVTVSLAVSFKDPKNCSKSPSRPSTLFPGSGLHFSYETCGFVETFGPRRLLGKLNDINSRIRISYPGNDAYRLYRRPDGRVSGSFVEVFNGVQEYINTQNEEPVALMHIPIMDSAVQFVKDEFNVESSYTGALEVPSSPKPLSAPCRLLTSPGQ